ncbi:MAG: hypothetical protein AAF648_17310, partial [Pseudomonadota bacterium]
MRKIARQASALRRPTRPWANVAGYLLILTGLLSTIVVTPAHANDWNAQAERFIDRLAEEARKAPGEPTVSDAMRRLTGVDRVLLAMIDAIDNETEPDYLAAVAQFQETDGASASASQREL